MYDAMLAGRTRAHGRFNERDLYSLGTQGFELQLVEDSFRDTALLLGTQASSRAGTGVCRRRGRPTIAAAWITKSRRAVIRRFEPMNGGRGGTKDNDDHHVARPALSHFWSPWVLTMLRHNKMQRR